MVYYMYVCIYVMINGTIVCNGRNDMAGICRLISWKYSVPELDQNLLGASATNTTY